MKYRVIESPHNLPEIAHPAVDTEDEAKVEAKRTVADTHNACFVERFNGEQWQRGSVMYCWYFERVCFYNRW